MKSEQELREVLAQECEARGFSFASQALQNPEKYGETHWTMVALAAMRRVSTPALAAGEVTDEACIRAINAQMEVFARQEYEDTGNLMSQNFDQVPELERSELIEAMRAALLAAKEA